ncbi:hypothetical protein CHELA40_15256 [Chelatococcus asaccharovorans]|nr:hypothetical protein CHELA17_60362 [Chelatococcus asaccharovorans]CAH1681971.1 hypothetical protein CHELA40_15256 [Chelatococcus asaccharovorans]
MPCLPHQRHGLRGTGTGLAREYDPPAAPTRDGRPWGIVVGIVTGPQRASLQIARSEIRKSRQIIPARVNYNAVMTWASSRQSLVKAVAKGADVAQISAIRRRWAVS